MTEMDNENQRNGRRERSTIWWLDQSLPWFRIVFASLGLAYPRVLGRWYGIYSPEGDGPNAVAIRYFCIRALGLGIGRITAPPSQQDKWGRVTLLVDAADTLMISYAGLTDQISKKRALGMLGGTVFATATGLLREINR